MIVGTIQQIWRYPVKSMSGDLRASQRGGDGAVNDGELPSAMRARSHGMCLRYQPAIESLATAFIRRIARHKLLLRADENSFDLTNYFSFL
jgi:hypothetical protein